MLSLPYTMMISGPLVALEFLVFFCIMAFFAGQSIVNAGLRCKKSTYGDIIRFYFGPAAGFIAEVLLSLALAVAAISYIVGLVDLLPAMLPFTGYLGRTARIIAVMITLYPVTLISNLAVFGPASAIAVAGCYIQATALVLNLFVSEWEAPPAIQWTAVSPGGLLFSLPMICFVYAYHYVLTETLSELENPTRMRMALVNLTTVGIMLGCYLPVSICGYLAMSGKDITSNILASFSGGPIVFIAQWSIGGLLLITYSLFIIPLRARGEMIFFGARTSGMKDPRRLFVAGLLALAVGVVSINLPDLGLANTLAGGCIAIVMFFAPGALMLRAQLVLPFDNRDSLRMGIGGIFMFMGALICMMGLFGNMLFDY